MKCPLKQRTEIEAGLIEDGVVTASTERVYDFGECDPECAWLFNVGGGICVCGIIYQDNKVHMIVNEMSYDRA